MKFDKILPLAILSACSYGSRLPSYWRSSSNHDTGLKDTNSNDTGILKDTSIIDTGRDTGSIDTSRDTSSLIDTSKDTGVEDTNVTNPGGPYNHKIYFGLGNNASYSDFINVSLVCEHCSVPNLLQLSQSVGSLNSGDLVAVYSDPIPPNTSQPLGISVSSDLGSTWNRLDNIIISSMASLFPADPSLIQLDDGSLRLYLAGDNNSGTKSFYALSTDLVTANLEGEVFSGNAGITDPDVIKLNSGSYLLSYSDYQTIYSIVSNDPLNFLNGILYSSSFTGCGVPGLVQDTTNGNLFAYCNDNTSNPRLFFSNDEARSFNYQTSVTGMGTFYCGNGGPSSDPFILTNGQMALLISGEPQN